MMGGKEFYFYDFFLLFLCFIYHYTGSLLLCVDFLQLQQVGATCQLKSAGLSLQWLLLLQSPGSRGCGLQQSGHVGSVVAAHGVQSTGLEVVVLGLSCPLTCGIFPDQGSNPCLHHWQADSFPLSHQGNPGVFNVTYHVTQIRA